MQFLDVVSDSFFQVWDVHDPYFVIGEEKPSKSGKSHSRMFVDGRLLEVWNRLCSPQPSQRRVFTPAAAAWTQRVGVQSSQAWVTALAGCLRLVKDAGVSVVTREMLPAS